MTPDQDKTSSYIIIAGILIMVFGGGLIGEHVFIVGLLITIGAIGYQIGVSGKKD